MTEFKNYYLVLGLEYPSDIEQVKRAFRELCKKYHPDRTGCDGMMKDINEAYAVLGDPERKEAYDREFEQHFGRRPEEGQEDPEKSEMPEPEVPSAPKEQPEQKVPLKERVLGWIGLVKLWYVIVFAVVLLGSVTVVSLVKKVKSESEELNGSVTMESWEIKTVEGLFTLRGEHDGSISVETARLDCDGTGKYRLTVYSEYRPRVYEGTLVCDGIIWFERFGEGHVSKDTSTGSIVINFNNKEELWVLSK